MPTFTFTGPDGTSYEINGPAGATKEQAFGILKQQMLRPAYKDEKGSVTPGAPGERHDDIETDPQTNYARNKAWSKAAQQDVYQTRLPPQDESKFQSWVKQNKVPFQDSPTADYDMRGFWKALQAGDPKAKSAVDQNDKRLHYPDYWKTPYHETFSAESQWANPDAPKWNDKDQLVDQSGKVLFDDRAGKIPESQRGFVDLKGNFLDRQGAAKIAKSMGMDVPDEMHSEDLNNATGLGKGKSTYAKSMEAQRAKPSFNPPESPDHPKWDIIGDIGRAASDSAKAIPEAAGKAFPSLQDRATQEQADRQKYGQLGGMLKGALVDPVERLGNAAKIPLSALGVAGSPITGALHGTLGSVFSYLPGMNKESGDAMVDSGMMGLGPKGMEKGLPGLAASAEAFRASSEAASNAVRANRVEQKATDAIGKRFAADAKAGGMTVEDAMNVVSESTKPLTLADLGGENVKALAGKVAREQGPSRTVMKNFLEERDKGAPERLEKDIADNIGTGSARKTFKVMEIDRSKEGAPIFEEAMKGGSMAPLESQFRQALVEATSAKGQIAKQIKAIEDSNPGALAARGAAGADVRAKYMELHEQLKQAEANRQDIQGRFKKAQEDRSANAPGAIWNPHIQRMLEQPEVKAGIATGLRIERLESAAGNRPFNATEYAVTGVDEKGKPIVGHVPNMKLLQAAKVGLDDMVFGDKYRDKLTGALNKTGRAIDSVRRALLKQLYDANPKFQEANEKWSGRTQSMKALKLGQKFFNPQMSPEIVAEEMERMTASDREFYKLGVADEARARIARAGASGDETKAIMRDSWMREKLKALNGSDEKSERFLKAVGEERQMFDTKYDVLGNSKSAARISEDTGQTFENVGRGANALAKFMSGHALGGIWDAWRLQRDLAKITDPAVNEQIARILTNPNIGASSDPGKRLLGTFAGPKTRQLFISPAVRQAVVPAMVQPNALRTMLPPQPPQGQ